MRPQIQGLYGIADATASDGDPVRVAAAMLEGGCRLLQLRCKGWNTTDIERAARELSVRCRAVGAIFIVNDHPEVAVASNAHGAHVGQLDAPASEVRRILGPHRIFGRSTHSVAHIEAALEEADYIAFGPVWATPNGGRDKPVRGLSNLAAARRAVPLTVPLVAIGGITPERLPQIRALRVSAWAVIGAICSSEAPVAATRELL